MKTNRYMYVCSALLTLVSCATGGCGTAADAAAQSDQALSAAAKRCEPDAMAAYTAADVSACACTGLLFWTESSVLRSSRLDGSGVTTVAVGTFPMGVALDNKARKLYWADNGTDAIYRANYDGSAQETLYRSPNSHANPDGLALDLSHGRMFWSESQAVRSAGLDGSGVADVLTGTPTGVALSPATSTLYWSDNVSDTIHRAAYDGTGAQLVYRNADPRSNPAGVKLEVYGDRLFWVEGSVVRSAASDGSGVRTVATGQFPTDVSVNPVLRKLYWTDNGTDTVNRANYDGSAAETLYTNTDPFSNPRGVAVAIESCAIRSP